MLNGLIAIASLLIALCFGPIEVVEFVLAVDVTPSSIAVHADPVFLVWDESNSIPGSAFAFGNTIVIEERWRGSEREAYIMRHEMIHVKQLQALGWLFWPMREWSDLIEPPHSDEDWTKPEENDARMWIPEWPRLYHFMTIEFRLGS